MTTVEFLRTLARARTMTSVQRWDEAATLWQWIVEANPVHGGYWDRLAQARFGRGDYAGALAAYRTVLELGAWERVESVFPHDVRYEVVRCLARLGETEQALAELRRAVDDGYRDLAAPRTDEHLESIRDDPRFAGILRAVDTAGMTRDEGWRADLHHLAAEVRRRSPAPFRRVSEEDFDAAVAALDKEIGELTDAEVAVGLMRLVALLGDGHAYVDPPAGDFRRSLPVGFFRFVEGVFVIGAAPGHDDLLGAQVLAVDGHPIDEVLPALVPVVSRDNEYWPVEAAATLLRQPPMLHALGLAADPAGVTLRVRHAEETVGEVRLAASPELPWTWSRPCPPGWTFLPDTVDAPLPEYLRNCGAHYWQDYLPEQRLVYFQLNNVLDVAAGDLASFLRRMFDFVDDNPVERFVVDLRFNTGGNTFLAMPLLRELMRRERICRRGGLFVVIGRRTYSAAQNLATLLGRHTDAVFVGEPTGSSPNFVGETLPFRLPYSGLEANISDLYWQTSWPMDARTWIAPDLYTPPTFAAFRANRDPALDAITALPTEHLPT